MAKVTYIDGVYIKYRKMWKEDRWKFSAEMVQLTIKRNKVGLDEQEQHTLNTMQRVVDENNGQWLQYNMRPQRKAGV